MRLLIRYYADDATGIRSCRKTMATPGILRFTLQKKLDENLCIPDSYRMRGKTGLYLTDHSHGSGFSPFDFDLSLDVFGHHSFTHSSRR
jgi:hypothetical protein